MPAGMVTASVHCRMQWCHTDLGAMAFRWLRLIEEDMRFGVGATEDAGPGPEHADGLLAARLKEAGVRLLLYSSSSMQDLA